MLTQCPLGSSVPHLCPSARLGGQVCRQWWQPLPRPRLLVSRPGACLGAGTVVSISPKLLVLVTETLLRLSTTPGAALATPGPATASALAALPSPLVVDGESRHRLLQYCLLLLSGLLLHCGWPDSRHHRLLAVSGVPDHISKLG